MNDRLPVTPGFVPSVCPHDCPSTCALRLEVGADGRLGRVRGGGQAYTDGVICAKVARYAERANHPERLLRPLRRVGPKGDGRFEPVSWNDALDIVAENLRRAMEKSGPESVWPYHYAGTMGLAQRAALRRLGHLAGWSRQRETFCVALADAGWQAGVGVKRGVDAREIVDSELIVAWGCNPAHTQINFMHWAHKACASRARLVVVDPYRTPTAERADAHLAIKPGTDGALACAVMHVLLAEGLADRAYLTRHTDFSPAVEAHLAKRSPRWAAAITGLSAEEIVAFARLYGSTRASFLRAGHGFTRQRNGAAAMHAVSCLPAVTGAWQARGGGALYGQAALYGLDRRFLNGLDRPVPAARALDMAAIGRVLNGEDAALAGGPKVAAMLIQNTNPAMVAPESAAVRRGFLRPDLFVCVHEQFMTDTARLADLILPATMFSEHDDLYQASGHTFLQAAKAAVAAPGECRSNHDFIGELAARLGVEHPAFDMDAAALADRLLRDSGKPGFAELVRSGGQDCALPFKKAHFLDGFGHADGRFRFMPDWSAIGPDHQIMPAFPDHLAVIEEVSADTPFRLVSAPARHFLNSSFTETESSRAGQGGRPTVLVHPGPAKSLGIGDGDPVRLGNRRGSVRLRARVTDRVPPGTLVVESLWPNACFAGGLGINALVGAEPGYPNGGAAYHDTAAWLSAEDGAHGWKRTARSPAQRFEPRGT
ncbi:MAG: molybdopterin oxidoreductase family protein [Candidatus Accumulibacter sp.]|jgi:anaerobic selenocysteine-containing dehydrogenase|nr:molybdopterin oxidoreductase family protein [Accumulibacter sp.]